MLLLPLTRIRWAVHNIRDQKVEEQIINSVYVRFITTNVSTVYVLFSLHYIIMHLSHPPSLPPVVQINELITEEHFHKVFDQFGNVEDVSIKESTVDKVPYLPTSIHRMILLIGITHSFWVLLLCILSVLADRVATDSFTSPATTPASQRPSKPCPWWTTRPSTPCCTTSS